MPRARTVPIAVALLAAAALAALVPRVYAAVDPSCGTQVLVGAAGQYRYRLAHTFARAGSDSVWTRRGGWTRGRDYLFDSLRGEIRVLGEIAAGETLWVSACWLLVPPPLEYARQTYRPAPPRGVLPARADTVAPAPAFLRPATGRDVGTAPGGASLAITGNKTVAVEFGSSQDAALRQSLDLAISGQLAPGVELTGVLSDRNTPLSVSGSTQDLQALDKVLVELRAPNGSAALGDIPLLVERGSFARLERRVQGVRGDWHQGSFDGTVAAASAQGEYRRLQFNGADGLQGPYLLTDAAGNSGIAVVAGSDVVTLDGQRMARGESADYFMDYERGRLTFTNRRPISSASRITIEYQFALTRFKRNLAAFSGGWTGGRARLFAAALTETDDRGRPLDVTFDAVDHLALTMSGDSASRAIGLAVVAGTGDYDSVRVAGDTLVYAYAGPDSGSFRVSFTRVALGAGDYADSAIVAGRTAYRWVGSGRGAFRIGRTLPLPESHQLFSLGGSVVAGPLTFEAEGAASRRDLNTFSPLDDGDNHGGAGRVSVSAEGAAPWVPGRFGANLGVRSVERRFQSFSRLERPFAEEDWGLRPGADLEHQRRTEGALWWRPRAGDELRADAARLSTPDGYSGTLRRAEWTAAGKLASHALGVWSDGDLSGFRDRHAGRRRALFDTRFAGRWIAPSLRLEHDDRRTPSDSTGVRDRVDEYAADLVSGPATAWHLAGGFGVRRDLHEAGLASLARRATTWRLATETPAAAPFGVNVAAQRRATRDLGSGQRTLSDLASARLRGERKRWGLAGQLDVEITGEAENKRVRTLRFVGAGRGGYDAFGNFVGTGDYDLVLAVSPELERYARVATSARAAWQFGTSDTWRGSRMDFTLEDEARRRGGLRVTDVFLSTGLALVDPALARGAIIQRLESDLAPNSRTAALHARLERRVSADRSYENYAQTLDQRSATLRWRARPSATVTLESEGRASWQRAGQVFAANRFARTLIENGAQSQLVWQRGAALRAAGALDVGFSRPESQLQFTRTIKLGPDLGFAVGARGRADLAVRRAFLSGPPASSLLPSADPAGAPRWDGNARFDLRLHESTTLSLSGNVRERPDHPAVVTARAEVRAFF